ncbi:hypothetical protein G3578_19250 [Brevibacillus sp. SYP-B805]|nr:hypothetical protein [Brevibacillus sp. SYP-B805]NGQ97279.1 hypothetical protein [Brevibacillus sp. SYP-B805]
MSDQRTTMNPRIRHPHPGKNRQPAAAQDDRPGYGDKKLEGPNRPST